MKNPRIIILLLAESIADRKIAGKGDLSETETISGRKDVLHFLLDPMASQPVTTKAPAKLIFFSRVSPFVAISLLILCSARGVSDESSCLETTEHHVRNCP